MALTGGCHCGAVRYTATGDPFDQTLCHCTICRGVTGAPAVAWVTVRPDALTLTGEVARYASSPGAERTFCPRCGTQLTFRFFALNEIDLTTGSLDHAEAQPPLSHTFTPSRLPWMTLLGDLPEHARGSAD